MKGFIIILSIIAIVVVGIMVWRPNEQPTDPVQEGIISAIEDARDGIDKDTNLPPRQVAPPEGWDGKG